MVSELMIGEVLKAQGRETHAMLTKSKNMKL